MRRAIVVPIVKALGEPGNYESWLLGPCCDSATVRYGTCLALRMRPISTHGLRGSIEALAFRGDEGSACCLCVGRPQGSYEDTECPSCLAACSRPDRLSLSIGSNAAFGPWVS